MVIDLEMTSVTDSKVMSEDELKHETNSLKNLKIFSADEHLNGMSNSSSSSNSEEVDGGDKGRVNFEKFPQIISIPNAATDLLYNMNHPRRGHCLIFNHSIFDKITKLGERNGTNRDRDCIQELFTALEFEVHVYNNLSKKEVKDKLAYFSMDENYSDCDCLVVFFLSHGEDDLLYARDGLFKADELFSPFATDKCPSLAGKPKMFFIQACRGDNLDKGVTVYSSNPPDETDYGTFYKIPTYVDFLICWSTIPGYYSWRNTTNGSWFIQCLVKIFESRYLEEDVVSLMTQVNCLMAYTFESNCPSSPHMHGMKQSASQVTTLTRKIFLRPKKKQ